MSVEKIIDGLIEREGGFSDNPADRGGATMYGITQAVARAHGYNGPMRDMPLTLARAIYLKSYYTGPAFDQVGRLSAAIAEELTDTGVNMGVGVAATFLQRALNVMNRQGRTYSDVTPDGHLGPKSITALDAYLRARGKQGESALLVALNCLQGARYIEIAEKNASQEEFVFGWIDKRVSL